MNTPKANTTAPATRCPAGDLSHRLSELAVNPPIRVNTTENPRTKATIGTMRVRVATGASPGRAWSPAMNDR
jgi:hypothetical protein